MANSFAPKESSIPLKPKAPPEPVQSDDHQPTSGLPLPAPKPKRKQCSLYLDTDMMDRVRRIAKKQGITIGAVIESCVKIALEKIDK